MLVPNHALYDAGASLSPLAVFVSTIAATSYVALPLAYPLVGCSRASHRPLPIAVAATANPVPVPPTNPPGGVFDASEPLLNVNENGEGAGDMRSSRNTSVNASTAFTDAVV